jgi:extradiol dioxygenase family protein
MAHAHTFSPCHQCHRFGSNTGFYGDVLGAKEGCSTETWVDFDFFGHQLSFHLGPVLKTESTGYLWEHLVPMPHFGMVLALPDWRMLASRLHAAEVVFVIPPSVRFEGEPGEQWTMFFRDPSGNPIEFKGFADLDRVFASH